MPSSGKNVGQEGAPFGDRAGLVQHDRVHLWAAVFRASADRMSIWSCRALAGANGDGTGAWPGPAHTGRR